MADLQFQNSTAVRASPPATRSMTYSEKRPCTGLEQPEKPVGSIIMEPTKPRRRGRPRKFPAEETGRLRKSSKGKGKGIEGASDNGISAMCVDIKNVCENAGSGDEGRCSPTLSQ